MTRGGATLYRARFSGFEEADDAEAGGGAAPASPADFQWFSALSQRAARPAIEAAVAAYATAVESRSTARIREVFPDGPTEADLQGIPLRRLGTPREIG